MGWLHDGHRSLMQRARAENATTIATIFVNPRQFNEAADYQRYPRNEARDLEICEEEGLDLVFAPAVEEVYPEGFDTLVHVGAVAQPLEGAARPGHFDGVATVVAILFNLVGADRAYFGQKDAQQVHGHPADGPRPRDRRPRSSPARRSASRTAWRSRRATSTSRPPSAPRRRCCGGRCSPGATAWEGGERSATRFATRWRQRARGGTAGRPEYVSVADGRTLAELETIDGPALLSLAVRFGETRLIDNEPIDSG